MPKSPKQRYHGIKESSGPVSIPKSLKNLWSALAKGEAVIIVYKDGKRKMITSSLKTPQGRRNATSKIIDDAQKDPQVQAILSSARSYDAFEQLEKKAKGKGVTEVLKNWRRYWTEKIEAKLWSV
jgi:hypothetical protein